MRNFKAAIHPVFVLGLIVILVLAVYLIFNPQTSTAEKHSVMTELPSKQHNEAKQHLPQHPIATVAPQETFDFAALDLSLLAAIVANPINLSSAVIESQGKVATYKLNQQIEQTGLMVAAIYHNYVVLVRGSNEYELRLTTELQSESKLNAVGAKPNSKPSESDLKLANEIGNRPKELAHIVGIMPTTDGFFVSPGLNPALFKAAQFKAGDVLQRINGKDLTVPEQLAEAKALIARAETLEFSVLRGGKTITLYLDIPAPDLSISP